MNRYETSRIGTLIVLIGLAVVVTAVLTIAFGGDPS